ncbi:MAG: aspartyl/asparaginyl beta-hydroxylase domain-containing protein [Planctomycetes bacterium]|nr:aspartyl/asparaginyl beta-hydroxylase domain-containing protein [Planctomycetota bacterium]
MLRIFIKLIKRIVPLVVAIYFFPRLTLFYVLCGLIDVMRNKKRNLGLFGRYFFGNGLLTWFLSPLNLLMDVLALPYRNQGIYELTDLPESHRQEITTVLKAADNDVFLDLLKSQMENQKRVMLFFKWYGANNETFDSVPEFHQPYKYIRTIGVSAFNKNQSTSEHFGPLRVTLRVLYNIGPLPEGDSFIEVAHHTNHWRDQRQFIFDDTLQHKSCNESDGIRYCMFIDILRPSPWPRIISTVLTCVRSCAFRVNTLFYKNWEILR